MNLIEKIIGANKNTQKKVPRFQGELNNRNIDENARNLFGTFEVPEVVPGEKSPEKPDDHSLACPNEKNLDPNFKIDPDKNQPLTKTVKPAGPCCRCCGSSLFWRAKGRNNWICGNCHPPALEENQIEINWLGPGSRLEE